MDDGAVDVVLAVGMVSFAQFLELDLHIQNSSNPARAAGHIPRAYGYGTCGRRDLCQAAVLLPVIRHSSNFREKC